MKEKAHQISEIKQSIDPGKRTIAFYHTIPAFRDHYGDLPEKLRNKDYNVLILLDLPKDQAHGFENDEFAFYVDRDILKSIDFVDLFFNYTNRTTHLPAKGKKVSLPHGISFLPNTEKASIKGFLRNFTRCINANYRWYDYFILQSSIFTNLSEQDRIELNDSDFKYFQDRIPREMLNHHSNEACFIPAGYPKLDKLIHHFQRNKQSSNTLIYAPTLLELSNSSFIKLGEHIIQTILNSFPSHEFVFRPHPCDIDHPAVCNVAEKYKDHPRFILDTSLSYMETYSKCALMISDFSGTAETFNMATLKPVVFIGHDFKAYDTENNTVEQSHHGIIVQDIKHLIKTIVVLLNTSKDYAEGFETLRNSSIANLGSSEDYIVDNIEYMLTGKKKREWIYTTLFSKNNNKKTASEYMDCIRRLLSDKNFTFAVEVSSEAIKRFPENLLLLWLQAYSLQFAGQPEEALSAVKNFEQRILKVPDSK